MNVEATQEFVRGMYRSILGRVPDNGGFEFYTRMILTGMYTWNSALRNFVNSDEARRAVDERITAAYQRNFGRAPDPEGMAWYKEQVAQGVIYPSDLGFDRHMQQSPEYGDYQANRPADSYGDETDTSVGSGTNEDPYSEPTTGGTTTTTTTDRNMSAHIATILKRYNLESLTGWVQGLMEDEDVVTDDQIQILLWERDEFKERFPGIEMMRAQGGTNIMSPEEYIEYENRYREIMRSAGIPEQFYDDYEDFTNLLVNRVSPSELNARMNEVFARVQQSPAEVRAKYAEWFGPSGDVALAMTMLDPDKALPLLETEMRTAEIGGFGSIFGFNTQRSTAEILAEMGLSGRDTISTYSQLQSQRSLFNETISETDDLDIDTEGVNASFGLDPDAADKIERRRASRVNVQSGGGGLLVQDTGVAGRADQ